jgi:hypothetical protein
VSATADHPTAAELDRLANLLAAHQLDRRELTAALDGIGQGLREHAHELDQTGGLLDETDKANRMSLAREDDRLRDEINDLMGRVDGFRQSAVGGANEAELRREGAAVLAALRGHRDAEASLVLENADTEVGSGD